LGEIRKPFEEKKDRLCFGYQSGEQASEQCFAIQMALRKSKTLRESYIKKNVDKI
jgi:hypothetical protein